MTTDPAPDETEHAGDLCAACGHERGEHLPPCEMGISTGRPCGCRQFKVPNETERDAPGSAEYWRERCHEAWAKGDQNAYRILELRAESVHRRDALHHAWAERDRLRVQLAELKAGRAAGAPPGVCLCRFGSTCDVCGPVKTGRLDDTCQCGRQVLAGAKSIQIRDYLHTGHVCRKVQARDSTPADRGPLTPHPPPWPVDEP